jgi:hypothetical protein
MPRVSLRRACAAVAQVAAVRADHVLVFKQLSGSHQVEVPFTAKRAADYRRGMVLSCTFVGLSDGSLFMTDCGYVFPSFYAPAIRSADDFGPFDEVELVMEQAAADAAAAAP